jgi:hypothetical protein
MAQIEEEKPQTFHYLLSGIQLEFDTFDLGNEAVLSKTYVHLMAHPVLAFTQPEGHGHHPGPWQVVEAAPGMSSIDLYAVLSITHSSTDARAPHDRASWITLLMRFSTDTAVTITLDCWSRSGGFTKVQPSVEKRRNGSETIGTVPSI